MGPLNHIYNAITRSSLCVHDDGCPKFVKSYTYLESNNVYDFGDHYYQLRLLGHNLQLDNDKIEDEVFQDLEQSDLIRNLGLISIELYQSTIYI